MLQLRAGSRFKSPVASRGGHASAQLVHDLRAHDGGSSSTWHEATLRVLAGRKYRLVVELTGGEREKSLDEQNMAG